MSDADIARQSNDSDGYLIIDGDGDNSLDIEVQEDFSAQKVTNGDDDGSPKRQAVNMDEIADLLNEGANDDQESPEENGDGSEGDDREVVAEDEIAVVKVGDVEASLTVQWPESNEEERVDDDLIRGEVPETEEQRDETQLEEEPQPDDEPVLIEVNGTDLETTPVADNEGTLGDVQPEDDDDDLRDDTPVADNVGTLVDVQPEVYDDDLRDDVQPEVDDDDLRDEPTQREQEQSITDEIDDTPVVIESAPEVEAVPDQQSLTDEIDDTPVVIEDTAEDIIRQEPVAQEEPEVDDTPTTFADQQQEEREIQDTPDIIQQEIDEDTVVIEAEPVVVEVNGNSVHEEEVEDEPGNVAIDVTLGGGQQREEETRKEEPKEEPTENEPISRDRGQSHKLGDTKFSKYQKSIEEPQQDEAPKPKSGRGRLDMSRFALFQKQSGDSPDGSPKRNFTIKPVNKSPRFNQGPSSTDSSNKCLTCDKRVYPMDKISADGKPFHKNCFRCAECKKVLNLGNYAALNSVIFCKPHFTQKFKLHGNYDTGFSKGSSLRSPNNTSAVNSSG